jgi:DNA-binding PadR family transcriptional regulator
VFTNGEWVGADAADKALDYWIEAGKRATAELKANPNKKYYSFNEKRWLPTTDNRETINQLRQMIADGEVNSSDWAALQVA